jgi:hypothetical protein
MVWIASGKAVAGITLVQLVVDSCGFGGIFILLLTPLEKGLHSKHLACFNFQR